MKFRQLSLLLFSAIFFGFISNSFAVENYRNPQNYVPDTDTYALYEEEDFIQDMWDKDHGGALEQLRLEVDNWQNNEQYIFNYGLSNFDQGAKPTINQKRREIEKGFLRYLDKRIMHNIEHAPKQSSLSKVKSAKKALRPSSTADISENFKIKFRARVLQGRGSILFINPWLDASAQFSLSGKLEFKLEREFQAPQILTQLTVNLKNEEWTALMQKSLTETLKAQVLAIQPTKSMALDNADRRIQLLYQKSF